MSSVEEKDALTQLYMGIGESLEKLIGISFSTFGFQKLVLLVRVECINSYWQNSVVVVETPRLNLSFQEISIIR